MCPPIYTLLLAIVPSPLLILLTLWVVLAKPERAPVHNVPGAKGGSSWSMTIKPKSSSPEKNNQVIPVKPIEEVKHTQNEVEVDASSFVEALESLGNAETTFLVPYQPAPQYAALEHPAPQQCVSQELVLYQPAPQQLVAQQQLVPQQHESAQVAFWASWVTMLLRSDELAHGEVDIDGLIEAFKSLSVFDTAFPAKKRPSSRRPVRYHPYRRPDSSVRGRSKAIATKARSHCPETSDSALALAGDLSGAHIQPSPHPDPAPLVKDAQPSQADNTIPDVAVTEQALEPALVLQPSQPEPVSDAQAAIPSPIADSEVTSVALAPIPYPPQPASDSPVLPAQSSHVPLPPLEKVEPTMQKDKHIQQHQPQQLVQVAAQPVAFQPRKSRRSKKPKQSKPFQTTPAPLAPLSSQKALPPMETVETVLQRTAHDLQQQQQQQKPAQQAELPAVTVQPAQQAEQAPQPLPTPNPAPAPEEEEEDEDEDPMLKDLKDFDADPLGYHATRARHAASFDVKAAQKAVAEAEAEAEADAPSSAPASLSAPAPAGRAEDKTGAPKPLIDFLDTLIEEEDSKNSSKKPAWMQR
ncbi:hypothetical protein VMCG_09839 [Cytospora schulzeri]|uniref:Uncharacterized protein n=1 Tax=Cytospora schulzeri TaxID=448051 RepID=A0A423VHP2_9PEZI|nr:hypothetical protein VMCG_09839 [Valsa malicola]